MLQTSDAYSFLNNRPWREKQADKWRVNCDTECGLVWSQCIVSCYIISCTCTSVVIWAPKWVESVVDVVRFSTHLMHQSWLAAGAYSLGAWRLTIVNVVGGVSEFGWLPPRKHVDDGVLDERREDEHETDDHPEEKAWKNMDTRGHWWRMNYRQTDDHPDVDRLDVGDTRQRRPSTAAHRRCRQHGQQADH